MVKRRDFLVGAGLLAAWPAGAQTTTPGTAPGAPSPVPAGAVRIVLQTVSGVIVADLFADKAPITCANFLRYVDHKLYDGGSFYRAVKVADNPLYGLVQAGVKTGAARFKPIAHESTAQTGLSHLDGTLSMARAGQGTATSDFFVCVGDASSSLDANPKEAGDNAGFAAFGRVVTGMEVVKAILLSPTSPTAGSEAMRGQMLAPAVAITSVRRL